MSYAAVKRKADDSPNDASKKAKPNASITSFFGQPKPVATASSKELTSSDSTTSGLPTGIPGEQAVAGTSVGGAVAAGAKNAPSTSLPALTKADKFNKEEWVEKLSDEQRDLLKLEIETLHESWLPYLADEIKRPEFLALKRFLKNEGSEGKKVFPPLEDVYSWSRHTPLPTVRAVILGQDPYHNVNQAHGLCFSVRPPTAAPPSLKNMYTALKKDYPEFKPPPKNGGLLTPWAKSGVLLLNTCLTVRAHEANSHANKGWEQFTQKVINVVATERRKGVVFLAWGKPAQTRCKGIKANSKHTVLESVHPSPLSAARGFFDCGHFKKANIWLKQRYGEEGEIDWNLDVQPEKAGV